ncbi:hypothetical protein CY34DRAFT_811903 [Suillus luteus UH-Slu-Lm8-n1]|uniref:Uncharacterized protein n=1 Tax=Suillus luteus UH-Slu-Lm8-n1 TaxID=930992 RepID=A0A0D0ACB1_9AGAM|nr:hypothetical protein CY34DRAFT_811903 [Suillus luteus UH-Slu-Lm8-n1]
MTLYLVFMGRRNAEVVALQSLAEKPSKGEDYRMMICTGDPTLPLRWTLTKLCKAHM